MRKTNLARRPVRCARMARHMAVCALPLLLAVALACPAPAYADMGAADAGVDATPPQVTVEFAEGAVADVEAGTAYLNRDAWAEVAITDASLDTAATTVNGTALAELLRRGDGAPDPADACVSYAAWTVAGNDDGSVCYSTTMRLEDGAYELPFVRAVDTAGNRATDAHVMRGYRVGALVVDTQAPRVRGAIDRVAAYDPARCGDEGSVVFLDARTTLVLAFEDATAGIARVEGENLGELRLEANGDLSGATVELPEGTFSRKATIVVSDHANNQYRWSLASWGHAIEGGVDSRRANEPLRELYTDELVGPEGHPRALVCDRRAPSLRFGKTPAEGATLREAVELALHVRDANLGRLALRDPSQVLVRVLRDGQEIVSQAVGYEAKEGDRAHDYVLSLAVDAQTHEDDGRYEVEASLRDLSGNAATATRTFVVDTTPPTLSVSYGEGTSSASEPVRYCGRERVARVCVTDKNLDEDALNADGLVRVVSSACHGRSVGEVVVGAWQRGATADEYVCEVQFPEDGEYTLSVFGTDVAGNPLVGSDGTQVDAQGRYDSGSFVVDATPPRAFLEYAQDVPDHRRFGGRDYFRQPVTLVATVSDRNLDLSRTTVTSSSGNEVAPDWQLLSRSKDGIATYRATIAYREETTGAGAGSKTPVLRALDLAGNAAAPVGLDFVVDQTAPYVDAATMSKEAAAEGTDAQGADPHRFYNERDGVLTRMSFVVCDEHLVDGVWIDDPDGAYDVEAPDVRGRQRVDVTLSLKDHDAQGAGRDTDFERNVRLFVRDVSGNMRTWTIDRTGTIEAERQDDASNTSLDGEGVYPMALVKDTTAPRLQMEGIEAGSYHNTTQTERVLVEEYNFDYLTRFRPQRPVVTIRKRAGNASGSTSTQVVTAREFEGSRPSYAHDCVFSTDGHYALVATLDDMAGNPSATVSLGEFTIDKTSPTISVSWDGGGVRNSAGGVDYYDAPRVATVTVEEHNFDASLMSVVTRTGSVGAWETNGDVHVCEVRFDADAPASAPHELKVFGRDLAGNEATPYTAVPFSIDTVAPQVAFLKRVSAEDRHAVGEDESELEDGTAFAAGVMPIVVATDDANFSAADVRVSLVGRRGEGAAARFAKRSTRVEGGVRIDWGNLGLEEGADGAAYRLDADDVYTIEAEVTDMAGNSSGTRSVSFSVNRYGSNFFVEDIGTPSLAGEGEGGGVLLQAPPRIVVHEVSVSGAEGTSHSVTKQYEHTPSAIPRTSATERDGYTLATSTHASAANAYEGWTEYVYTIQSGNFGEGSSSDYGDGGQGVYRVDVSSADKASNHNTTSSFFATDAARGGDGPGGATVPAGKTATIEFTLDEFGPAVEDVEVPGAIAIGDEYLASFRLTDDITRGDYLEVLVDGEPVEVRREGEERPLAKGEVVQPGTFFFRLGAQPITRAREVVIRAWDYTGLEGRAQTVRRAGIRLTTLVGETLVVVVAGAGLALATWAIRRHGDVAEPRVPTRA